MITSLLNMFSEQYLFQPAHGDRGGGGGGGGGGWGGVLLVGC
jgi:hypothetical protein